MVIQVPQASRQRIFITIGCVLAVALYACQVYKPSKIAQWHLAAWYCSEHAYAADCAQDDCPIFTLGENKKTVLQSAALAAKWKGAPQGALRLLESLEKGLKPSTASLT